MHFKYQKISDKISHYNINKKILSKKSKWIVTEKVHGSNFSIYYNEGSIKFSKRNKFLSEDEWFYNYQFIKQKLIQNITKLSKILNENNIIIYGELFGGWYPEQPELWKGPENVRINSKGISIIPFHERAIQEGIYYSPNIEYMIFDICIIKNNNPIFIDYLDLEKYIKQTDFFYAKPLFIGSFQNAQKFNIEFNSKIPNYLGLKELPHNTNIAEGIVIRPNENYFIEENKRCLIKIKNKKFCEIDENFDIHEAKKSYQYIFNSLINQNRLHSVISKIGIEDKELILKEFIEDVWNDFYLHYSNIQIYNLDKTNEYIQKISLILLKENNI